MGLGNKEKYQVIFWPQKSPDLNVIENVGNMWGSRLLKRFSGASGVTFTEEELWAVRV